MSRPLRVEYAGAFYHVINRGNAREKIFYGDKDRDRFLQYLAVASERFSIIIKSYCLMTNHYHLFIQTPEPNLAQQFNGLMSVTPLTSIKNVADQGIFFRADSSLSWCRQMNPSPMFLSTFILILFMQGW